MSQNPGPYGQQPDAKAPYGQPAAPYGQSPYGAPYGAPAEDPGKTLSIVAIILPFVGFSLVSLILGFVAKAKSAQAGFKNPLATAAIIVSIVMIVLSIAGIIIFFVLAAAAVNEFDSVQQVLMACLEEGAESVTIGGQEFSCSSYN